MTRIMRVKVPWAIVSVHIIRLPNFVRCVNHSLENLLNILRHIRNISCQAALFADKMQASVLRTKPAEIHVHKRGWRVP